MTFNQAIQELRSFPDEYLSLNIQPLSNEVKQLYSEKYNFENNISYINSRDAGFDLIQPKTIWIPDGSMGFKLKLGVVVQMEKNKIGGQSIRHIAYQLIPRSSIIKTSLRLANSIGLIDVDYRGELMAAVDCHVGNREGFTFREQAQQAGISQGNYDTVQNFTDENEKGFLVIQGRRLFQVISPNLECIEIARFKQLNETLRGSGGFGSTGH